MAGQQIIVMGPKVIDEFSVIDDGWADGIDNVNNVAVTEMVVAVIGDAGSQAKPKTESPASVRFRARMNLHWFKYEAAMAANMVAEHNRARAEHAAQKKPGPSKQKRLRHSFKQKKSRRG